LPILHSFPTRRSSDLLCLGLLAFVSVICLDKLHAQSLIDPAIKDIIQKAFETNKELKLKAYEVDKARLEVDGVKANRLPHVSALDRKSTRLNSSHVKI